MKGEGEDEENERAGPDLIEQPRIKREISEGGGIGGPSNGDGRRDRSEEGEKRARGERRGTKRERRRTPAATANRLRG